LPAHLVIHNQCSNIEPVPLVYFRNGTVYPELSDSWFINGEVFPKPFDQQIDILTELGVDFSIDTDVVTELRVEFSIDTIENKFESVLLFKLKKHIESDEQHDIDTSTTGTDENEATHAYMLVVWEVKNAKSFAYVALVERIKEFTWDKDKLKEFYNKNYDQLKKYSDTISDTWLVDNDMILKAKSKVKSSKRNQKLSIYISEEKKSDHAMRPFCINIKR
jgi:hypothetical protein